MPTKPLSPCATRGCPHPAVARGRCVEHAQVEARQFDARRPTSSQRGYGSAWQRIRREHLAKHPFCVVCGQPATDVDHITPKALGGSDEEWNRQSMCHRHHSSKTMRQSAEVMRIRRHAPSQTVQQFAIRERDLKRREFSRVIHICGQPASGKGWLRAALDQTIGLPSFGIDDERLKLMRPEQHWPDDDLASWAALEDKVNAYDLCVVETSGTSPNDAPMLRGRQVLTVLCVASDSVRRARLAERVATGYRFARGHDDYIAALMRAPSATVSADIVLDTTEYNADAFELVIQSIEDWLQRTAAAASSQG